MKLNKIIIGKNPEGGKYELIQPFYSHNQSIINNGGFKQYNYDPVVVVDIVEDYIHGEKVEYDSNYVPFKDPVYIPVDVENKCWYGYYPSDLKVSLNSYHICEMKATHYRKAKDSEILPMLCHIESKDMPVEKILTFFEGKAFLKENKSVLHRVGDVNSYRYDFKKRKYCKILEDYTCYCKYESGGLKVYLICKTNLSSIINFI